MGGESGVTRLDAFIQDRQINAEELARLSSVSDAYLSPPASREIETYATNRFTHRAGLLVDRLSEGQRVGVVRRDRVKISADDFSQNSPGAYPSVMLMLRRLPHDG